MSRIKIMYYTKFIQIFNSKCIIPRVSSIQYMIYHSTTLYLDGCRQLSLKFLKVKKWKLLGAVIWNWRLYLRINKFSGVIEVGTSVDERREQYSIGYRKRKADSCTICHSRQYYIDNRWIDDSWRRWAKERTIDAVRQRII